MLTCKSGFRDVKLRPSALKFKAQGLTKPSFKAECDVNAIVARYRRDGVVTHMAQRSPQYADVSQVPDFQGALEVVRTAQAIFAALPSSVRSRFGNDPARMVAFVSDPDCREEAVKLGLLKAPAVPSPAPASPPAPKETNPAPAGPPV